MPIPVAVQVQVPVCAEKSKCSDNQLKPILYIEHGSAIYLNILVVNLELYFSVIKALCPYGKQLLPAVFRQQHSV